MRPFPAPGRSPAARAVALVAVLAPLGGCFSYWDLAADENLEYGCSGKLNWYPDCDRDGFGAPGAGVVVTDCELQLDDADIAASGCEAGEGIPLASNQLDCDDTDPGVTANVGICPQQIGEGQYIDPLTGFLVERETPSNCVIGAQAGGVEYVATCFDENEARSSVELSAEESSTGCVRWGGSLRNDEAADEIEGFVGLARLRTESDGLTALLDEISATGVRAVWLDLSYDFAESSWSYQGAGDADNIPQAWLPCPGPEPSLADFVDDVNPNLVNQDSDGDGVPDMVELEQGTDPHNSNDVSNERTGDRLALILQDDGVWCWGAPARFGLPAATAYALCQRPIPDPRIYAVSPGNPD